MENQEQEQKENKRSTNEGFHQFAKYSALGFQMAGIILVTVWGGTKLDALLETEKPIFTLVLSLLGIFAAIYTAIKDFIKLK